MIFGLLLGNHSAHSELESECILLNAAKSYFTEDSGWEIGPDSSRWVVDDTLVESDMIRLEVSTVESVIRRYYSRVT